ncbi:MAG: PilT protein domain protein [Phycisphaerales bacterium]|jgi:PIN domain nuclease of toxin-antitoxin system|nr:PilT protein domain protein [Phycisphaerales bacterium]
MRLLLDTHTFLWFINGDQKLSPAARNAIQDPTNESHVSIASVWEMAIKVSIGKLGLAQPFPMIVPHELKRNGFRLFPIELSHCVMVSSLPFHHRDPFDRLLIAQSLAGRTPIVSADAAFDAYGVVRIW